MGNKGPRLGPKTRHLVFVPLFFLGRNYTVSRRPGGVYTHAHIRRSKEQRQASNDINFTVFLIQMEAWYIRQTGRQYRQLGHFLTEVLKQQLKGIFPPVDVIWAYYLEGYMLYYLSCLFWRFCT